MEGTDLETGDDCAQRKGGPPFRRGQLEISWRGSAFNPCLERHPLGGSSTREAGETRAVKKVMSLGPRLGGLLAWRTHLLILAHSNFLIDQAMGG